MLIPDSQLFVLQEDSVWKSQILNFFPKKKEKEVATRKAGQTKSILQCGIRVRRENILVFRINMKFPLEHNAD